MREEADPQQFLTQSGWLKKKSPSILAGWQRRFWMVAQQGTKLAYFDQEKGRNELKGYLEIRDVLSIQKVDSHRFTLTTTARDWQLEAPSPEERDLWVKVIWALKTKLRSERAKSQVSSPLRKPKTRNTINTTVSFSDKQLDEEVMDRIAKEKQKRVESGKLAGISSENIFVAEDVLNLVGLKLLTKKTVEPRIKERTRFGQLGRKMPNKKYLKAFFIIVSAKSLRPQAYLDDQLLHQNQLPPWMTLDVLFQIKEGQSAGRALASMKNCLSVMKADSKTEKGFKFVVDLGESNLSLIANTEEQRQLWISSILSSMRTAKEMSSSKLLKRNIDGLLQDFDNLPLAGRKPMLDSKVKAQLKALLDKLTSKKLDRLLQSFKVQHEWLEGMVDACLAKSPKRTDLAQLLIQLQRQILVSELGRYWDECYSKMQIIQMLKVAQSLSRFHASFKGLYQDKRLQATIRVLVQIFFSNTQQKMNDFLSSLVDNQRIITPSVRDGLLFSATPVDLFKLIYQPVQTARGYCDQKLVAQSAGLFAKRVIQKFFVLSEQLMDQCSLDDDKLVCICNNTLQFVRASKQFEAKILQPFLDQEAIQKVYNLQSVNQWFIQIGNTARLQLFLSCFGDVSQMFGQKSFLGVELEVLVQKLQSRVEVLGQLHQSFNRRIFKQLLEEIVTHYLSSLTKSAIKEGKAALPLYLTKLKRDCQYLGDGFKGILFMSTVSKCLKPFQDITSFLTDKSPLQLQKHCASLCTEFGKTFSSKTVKALLAMRSDLSKLEMQSALLGCQEVISRVNNNRVQGPAGATSSQDEEFQEVRLRRMSMHQSEDRVKTMRLEDQSSPTAKKAILQEGYLKKKKTGKPFYESRYFKLSGDSLYWFTEATSMQAQNKIEVSRFIEIKAVDTTHFTISVEALKGQLLYQFKASSTDLRDRWVESIKKTVEGQEDQKLQPAKQEGREPYIKDYFEEKRIQVKKRLRAQARKKRQERKVAKRQDNKVRRTTIAKKLQSREKIESPTIKKPGQLQSKAGQTKTPLLAAEIVQQKKQQKGCCERFASAMGFY